MRFTALFHLIYAEAALREAYERLNPKASAGTDGVTWKQYGENLEANLRDLSGRLKRGAYRAKPVRRVYIAKEDGRQRPLGVPALEDKLVQLATVAVLNAIYEVDFLGFSYGFRPGRGPHNALDALAVGLVRRKVNWVLDADIRAFFDTVERGWLVKFVEHRIADKRVVRLIQKWLNAGVLEEGKRTYPEKGTPQGGSISPLLANLYLHYVFDLWADQGRQKQRTGDVIIVRYADDFVVGFEQKTDAERFLSELRERFQRFGLELHADKTRLIEFGRFAATNRRERGVGKPETFDFLGFTHICATARNGWFQLRRVTMRKRLRRKLQEVKAELSHRLHVRKAVVGAWLHAVVRGHYGYYGVPGNIQALQQFRDEVTRLWKRALGRRSQKGRVTWPRMQRLAKLFLPPARNVHPYPDQRLVVMTGGRSPVR
jgi:group II intron reverse transcriptase/maturase